MDLAYTAALLLGEPRTTDSPGAGESTVSRVVGAASGGLCAFEKEKIMKLPPVHVYLNEHPQETGGGQLMRFYSNTRAFLDLGYEVESVQITTDPEATRRPPASLSGLRYSDICIPIPQPSLVGRLFYRLGILRTSSLSYYFPCHEAIRDAVLERERLHPGAIHVLEGDIIANAILSLPRLRLLFGHHDIFSEGVRHVQDIARERAGNRLPTSAERRECRFGQRYENATAARAQAVLCGSLLDQEVLHGWGVSQAEYLPCSSADERLHKQFDTPYEGKLRLVHVGRLNHLPSFRSLELLLGQVWPRLPASLRQRLHLRIIGRIVPGNPLTEMLLKLADPFPEVELAGYIPNLEPEFKTADLHVVFSTAATGYRTRIIESFAAGLPVLANAVAVGGLDALRPDENIFIANDVETIIAQLEALLTQRSRLADVAANAAATYRDHYSRPVVAKRLAEILRRYLPDAAPLPE